MDTTAATFGMVACWAAEAVKAHEAGDERQTITCFALMFGAIATAKGDARRILKAGLDSGERSLRQC